MSGCHARGHLIGGYVLGALEPAEEAGMGRHLESCSRCAREQAELAGLPALLDWIEPGDVPPPLPPPSLEEGLLDRVARESRSRRRASAPRRRRAALAGALAAAVIGLALALVVAGGDEAGDAYARAELHAPGGRASAHGRAHVSEVAGGTRVRLRVRELAGGGAAYELWCVRGDGRWVSGGTFHAKDGDADVELTAAVAPGDYHRLVVTLRDGRDGRGPAVLRGALEY